ncbi:hypothetical protein D9M69_556420 [compost metagenome]
MAVQVLEAVAVHEAVVLRLARRRAAGGHRLGDQLVDLGAALARQAHQHLVLLAGVGDALVREGLEVVLHQQHRVDAAFVDDHAGGVGVGELRVEGVAQRAEEGLALVEVPDGEVHEDLLGGHGEVPVSMKVDRVCVGVFVYAVHKRYQRKWTVST